MPTISSVSLRTDCRQARLAESRAIKIPLTSFIKRGEGGLEGEKGEGDCSTNAKIKDLTLCCFSNQVISKAY